MSYRFTLSSDTASLNMFVYSIRAAEVAIHIKACSLAVIRSILSALFFFTSCSPGLSAWATLRYLATMALSVLMARLVDTTSKFRATWLERYYINVVKLLSYEEIPAEDQDWRKFRVNQSPRFGSQQYRHRMLFIRDQIIGYWFK